MRVISEKVLMIIGPTENIMCLLGVKGEGAIIKTPKSTDFWN